MIFLLSGLVKTFVKNSLYEDTKNCGFCFLEYDCHSNASRAKRALNRGNVWGRQLFVDWAQRRKQFDEIAQENIKTLFINYLPKEITDEQINDALSSFGTIEKVTKIKDYAFVLFTEHDAAVNAMGADKEKLGHESVEISLAIPKKMKIRVPSLTNRRFGPRTSSVNFRTKPRYTSDMFYTMRNKEANTKIVQSEPVEQTVIETNIEQTIIPSMLVTPPEQLPVN